METDRPFHTAVYCMVYVVLGCIADDESEKDINKKVSVNNLIPEGDSEYV